LKERGIDKMLEEAREDHKENDAENMQQKCEPKFPINSSMEVLTDM
jgi:hypothetical protein